MHCNRKLTTQLTVEVNWDTALANIEKTFGGPQAREEGNTTKGPCGVWGKHPTQLAFLFMGRPTIYILLHFQVFKGHLGCKVWT